MSLSQLPLSYCTNVHAGRSVAEVVAGLDKYTVAVQSRFGQPLAAGLWLARPVVDELLATPDGVKRFADGLRQRGLTCHTLNAFPYGDFHGTRVKENVYLPDWASADRVAYTLQCATVLSELLPDDIDGSISTLPLGFKGYGNSPGPSNRADFIERCIDQLVGVGQSLAALRQQTGKMIRLAIEPEPLCILETTGETMDFFRRLLLHAERAGVRNQVEAHIGVCYDICHQAVEFEDVTESIRQLDDADIRINKVHISCALQLDRPASNTEGRQALARYVEPRYLHQATAIAGDGKVVRQADLSEAFIANPPAGFAEAAAWRIHFHVPVNAHHLGPLATTRPDLHLALAAVSELNYAPHLEVETYTWDVMPGMGTGDLVDGLTRELVSTAKLLHEVAVP